MSGSVAVDRIDPDARLRARRCFPDYGWRLHPGYGTSFFRYLRGDAALLQYFARAARVFVHALDQQIERLEMLFRS